MTLSDFRIFNAQDGLCVRVAGASETFIFDCGTHRKSNWQTSIPPALLALRTDHVVRKRPASVLAVSHLHSDHFNGLLTDRLSVVRNDVKVLLPRLPRVEGDPQLAADVLLYLTAIDSLSSKHGLGEIDLLKRMRRYAPHLQPHPISRGDRDVKAAGIEWECLWPPRTIPQAAPLLQGARQAIVEIDRLAADVPELRDVLEKVRDAHTYQELLNSLDTDPEQGHGAEELLDLVEGDEPDEDEAAYTLGAITEDPAIQRDIERLNRRLRQFANSTSLVLRARNDEAILFGDATKSAVTASLRGIEDTVFGIVVNPHHGGGAHRPKPFPIRAKVFASSSGPWLTEYVDPWYARHASRYGRHHVTHYHGGLRAKVSGSQVLKQTHGLRLP
jgi:hypothetical protein